MYNSEFVKKKKRRKVVAVITGISGITVAVLVIISFLGRYVGTFTIRLDSGTMRIALRQYDGSSSDPEGSEEDNLSNLTTYLRVNRLPTLCEDAYSSIMNEYGDGRIDSGKSPWYYGATPNGYYQGESRDSVSVSDYFSTLSEKEALSQIEWLHFFKFTFYVDNQSSTVANYRFTLKIVENIPTDEPKPRYLDDTLRIVLYQNLVDKSSTQQEHKKTIFAKSSEKFIHTDEEGKKLTNEAIAYTMDFEPLFGYAEEFESDSIITSFDQSLGGRRIMRYTILFWLEGTDPESNPELEPPKNASLKLGVEIDAYEKDDQNNQ